MTQLTTFYERRTEDNHAYSLDMFILYSLCLFFRSLGLGKRQFSSGAIVPEKCFTLSQICHSFFLRMKSSVRPDGFFT